MDRVTFYTFILFFLFVTLGLLIGLFIIYMSIFGLIELYRYLSNKKSTTTNRALNRSFKEESAAFAKLFRHM